jgi:hypothetical protein
MLRLVGRTTQEVDAWPRTHLIVRIAVGDGVVGGNERGKERHYQEKSQDDHSYLCRSVAQEMAQRISTQAARFGARRTSTIGSGCK